MYTTLITAEQLKALLGSNTTSADVVIVDTSSDLMDPAAGERSYLDRHIRGAHYLHPDREMAGAKTGRNGRHPLPVREGFAHAVAALGITPGTQVVVYDRQGAMYAVRAWWLLRWLGHRAVAVLDGGLPAWEAVGGAVDAAVPQRRPDAAPYPAAAAPAMPTLDADALLAQLGRVALVDARAGERFRGEVEPLDKQAGHIPGAKHRFFKDNLGPDGRFKSAQTLRAEFTQLLGNTSATEVVHQCGSGVTACHNLFAMEYAGLGTALLYPGSWSEWSSDPSRPVATS